MNPLSVGAAFVLVIAGGSEALTQSKSEPKVQTPEFRKVETRSFAIEVPAGWSVSDETPWGARDIRPDAGSNVVNAASMSSMTGPGLGRQSWDRLYETSLYFITRFDRQGKMKAEPYAMGKSRLGFETCSWNMLNAKGAVLQRHVILKHENGNILALSVKVPEGANVKERAALDRMFRHMVDTAIVK